MEPQTEVQPSVSLLGEPAAWFAATTDGEMITLRPSRPLPRRCTVRAAALFEQDRGFPDVNTVMGRLTFSAGSTQSQRYRPFTQDPSRHLRELFFRIEAMPDDDWPTSSDRWHQHQQIARRLLDEAEVPWTGLTPQDVDELVRYVPWPEPLEGCVLHALTQWTHDRGSGVIEIGSFRGRSLSMMAMALRGVACDSMLLSIDPHEQEPHNLSHVRLALRQIGEEKRLVQFPCRSDEAWKLLRPRSASLIFVDGNHAREQVLADFHHYRTILAPGGCLLFHDYGYGNHNGRPEADPEVRPAIDECVLPDKGFRPLLLAHTLLALVKTNGEESTNNDRSV